MLGPVVELELVRPANMVPDGVKISIRHFLTVPHSREAQEALYNSEDQHHIVKLTMVEGRLEMKVLETIHSVTSEYFSTENLSGQSLCWVTPVFSLYHACLHSSLKEIIFTKDPQKCSHEGYSLNAYCVCPSAKEGFVKQVEDLGQELTKAVMTQNIDKSSDTLYDISIGLTKRNSKSETPEKREINHVEMCEYAGIRKLGGLIEQTPGCGCETLHCGRSDAILRLEVAEKKPGSSVKIFQDSFSLACEKKREPAGHQTAVSNVQVNVSKKITLLKFQNN